MTPTTCNHVVYWPIPLINSNGKTVTERHYAVNLAELEPEAAQTIESMLCSHHALNGDPKDPRDQRSDPKITRYRHLFRPFIEVKKQAHDLCRFSMVRLPFAYAEYADEQVEPRHHTHPSVRPLAGTG